MQNKEYQISVLSDFSRLDDVYRLTHDTLIEAGDIQPKKERKFIAFPDIDHAPETTILIAEKDGVIIGTISFTLDGPNGLHISKWFKDETNYVRNTAQGSIGTFWRIATDRNFRRKRTLVLDLMAYAFSVAIKEKCDFALLISTYRHIRFYQHFIGAEVIARKQSALDEGCVQVDTAMMGMHVLSSWGIFQKKRHGFLDDKINHHEFKPYEGLSIGKLFKPFPTLPCRSSS